MGGAGEGREEGNRTDWADRADRERGILWGAEKRGKRAMEKTCEWCAYWEFFRGDGGMCFLKETGKGGTNRKDGCEKWLKRGIHQTDRADRGRGMDEHGTGLT